jgi:class 3 adenylate cyclase
MEEPGNQTVMCSVFFVDIVEYSRKSVTEQILLKERFNGYLATAIQDVPITDRIILDTSDGAAITFLGDVEDALKTALSLRGSLLSEDPDTGKPLSVRMGINLGPVRLVRDANGQPNIVGDGINVAQLVMSFANAGQILVSRSYYNAATRLSPHYAGMFLYQGSRTDKHVREHEVYAIGHRGDKSKQEDAIKPVVAEQAENPLTITLERAKSVWHSAATKLKVLIEHLVIRFMHATLQQRVLYVGAVATLLFLLIILAVKLVDPHEAGMKSNRIDKQSSSESRIAAAVAPESSVQANSGGKGNNIKQAQVSSGPQQKAVESKVVPSKPKPKPKSEPKAEPMLELKSNANHPESRPKAKIQDTVAEKAAVATSSGNPDAYISVNCKEGTEIFVDGVRKGRISSGLLTIPISPGKHTVIVSHPRAGVFSQDIAIDAGKTVRLNPSFCN